MRHAIGIIRTQYIPRMGRKGILKGDSFNDAALPTPEQLQDDGRADNVPLRAAWEVEAERAVRLNRVRMMML